MSGLPALEAEAHRIAAAYPPDAASTPRDERERHFSAAQRLAWELRFGTPASVDAERLRIEDMSL